MRTLLVVGGAGYVGSVLTAELLERGYAVRVLDRLYFGDAGLRDVRSRVDLRVGDMRAPDPAVFDDVHAVINLGGLSNDPTAEYNPRANHEMNTEAALTLAELARRRGVRRYLYASSCSVYDQGITSDERDQVLDETAELAPRAAYSASKFAAEQRLLRMAGPDFCPVILRKGTVFGYSPRMRYDLVVNTFVKDALTCGRLTLHYGGEMWRPLVDVRDAARAYIAAMEAPDHLVAGEIFNVSYRNFRVSEVALRVQAALAGEGVRTEIVSDYSYRTVRSYRVSARKIEQVLGLKPVVTVEESVRDMVAQIRRNGLTDFDHPRYYNIQWMRLLEEAQAIIGVTGTVWESPGAGWLAENPSLEQRSSF